MVVMTNAQATKFALLPGEAEALLAEANAAPNLIWINRVGDVILFRNALLCKYIINGSWIYRCSVSNSYD